MRRWRPRSLIRVIAVGPAWRDGRLLAAEVGDDAGGVKGARPLGGALEFGERWRDALVREFREEVGVRIEVTGPPLVLEDIYRHEGATGHEIVFAADVALPPGTVEGPGPHVLHEDDGAPFVARWVELGRAGPQLLPEGLAAALDVRARGG